MKKYWGYVLKEQKNNDLPSIKRAAKAPLEHLFGTMSTARKNGV